MIVFCDRYGASQDGFFYGHALQYVFFPEADALQDEAPLYSPVWLAFTKIFHNVIRTLPLQHSQPMLSLWVISQELSTQLFYNL